MWIVEDHRSRFHSIWIAVDHHRRLQAIVDYDDRDKKIEISHSFVSGAPSPSGLFAAGEMQQGESLFCLTVNFLHFIT